VPAYGFTLNLLVATGFILLIHGSVSSAPGISPEKFVCGDPATPVSAVQGPGTSSPMAGIEVDIEAIVVGTFQKPGELGGLFVQEEARDQDRNPDTSEGLFAFTTIPAQVGDVVRIRGTVTEYKGLTELHPVTKLEVCGLARTLPEPANLSLPGTSADFEAVENMRVRFSRKVVITDISQLVRYGELVVSSQRLYQPTQVTAPGDDAARLSAAIRMDRLIIDDWRTGRDLPVRFNGQDNATPFSAGNPIRTGQAITGLEGIMHYAFDDYRIQPIWPVRIEATSNPRPMEPDPVGGTLRVSVFNVLNYFSTLDSAGPVCGPLRNQTCRGARTPAEQKRQLQKLTAALLLIDADMLALIELENNEGQSLRDVADSLNFAARAESWAYVTTGSIGQDAIKTGILFKPATVSPEGPFAILNHNVDTRYNDALNRPALAQSFRLRQTGELLTLIVAHLKSRSCQNAKGADANQKDGQACFNHTRTMAAAAMADWALNDPTGSGSKQLLVLGDFNSHLMEIPIRIMQEKGLVNLLDEFHGLGSYTYVYDGMAGTLDHAFASPELFGKVTGITVWHINTDESAALDYRTVSGDDMNDHAPSPFRSSDHDPIVIGLAPGPEHTWSENRRPAEDSATLRYTLLAGMLLMLIAVARRLGKG